MSDDLDAKLDAIFNARAERIAEAKRVRQEAEQKQERSLEAFLDLKCSVIRPTLDALAHNLTDRGLESRVFEVADGQPKGNEVLPASIGIKFLHHQILQIRDGEDAPHLTLTLDKALRRVVFHFSNVFPGRKNGEEGVATIVDFDSVTATLINDEALKVIGAIHK
jgi:hypothetical protein